MHYILLIIGFILIIKASDILVDASKSLALTFKVSKILIALTVVAFGTCAPELAISFNSIATNNGSIALANVVGSCIVNILLVIGVAAFTHPIKVKNATIKKELPLLVMITTVFSIIILNGLLNPFKNNTLNSYDGILLMFLFTVFMIYIFKLAHKKDWSLRKEKPQYSITKSIIYLFASIIIISYSASLLVDNAILIATDLKISQKLITMIAIVIGTSLPELFLTIASARKKESEIAIGNIIGTNIFNISIVMGLPTAIFNGFTMIDFSIIDIAIVFTGAFLLYIFSKSERTLSRKEGMIMISIFILYYTYMIIA